MRVPVWRRVHRALLAVFAPLVMLCPGLTLPAAASADAWNPQVSPVSVTLHGVDFIDSAHGWAVGDLGVILATANGGATWSSQTSGVGVALKDVCFVTADRGWAAGFNGTILSTTNGGATWEKMTSGTTYNLHAVAFVTSARGWVAGDHGTLRTTTNGGASWSDVSSPPLVVASLRGIDFSPDGSVGYAVGDLGTMVRIAPGPAQTAVSPTTAALYGVAVADGSRGFITGSNGTVLTTTRAAEGGPWIKSTYGFGLTFTMFAVACTDAANAWVVGQGAFGTGSIDATEDGGATWDGQDGWISDTRPFHGIDFVDVTHGWLVGENGVIFATDNGGHSHPLIMEFTPTSGPAGTTITIIGSNLYDVTTVTLNGSPMPFTEVDSGQVRATVPAGARTGAIEVTTLYGSTFATDTFRVTVSPTPTPPGKPRLSRVWPTKGRVGSIVTLTGRRFGSKRGKSIVRFGATRVKRYAKWSATKVKVKVPKGTRKGAVTVVVKTSGGTSNGKRFVRR